MASPDSGGGEWPGHPSPPPLAPKKRRRWPWVLGEVVEKDLFRAEITVEGAKSYDTAIGGSTTAPQLTVTKIDVIGHID